MSIAIIGAGHVGTALSQAFRSAGEDVVIGVRDPSSAKHAPLRSAGLQLEPPVDAVNASTTLLLAVPWQSVESAIAGLGDLSGKILVDATNPILSDFSDIDPSPDRSGGEAVARFAGGAKVVKAFNTMTSYVMGDPDFGAVKPALAIATDHSDARREVERLGTAIGFQPYDAGPLSASRETERLAWHVINMAVIQGHRPSLCFAVLDKGH